MKMDSLARLNENTCERVLVKRKLQRQSFCCDVYEREERFTTKVIPFFILFFF